MSTYGTNNDKSNKIANETVEGPDTENDASNYGSSLTEATFNFISSLVGAGIIGFGGAIADAGGLLSLISILFFACLSKGALDLVVSLAAETEGAGGSFEDLATVAYGGKGRAAVMVSKGLFAFGCLVAFIKITKDNLGPSSYHFLFGEEDNDSMFAQLLLDDDLITIILCTLIMLPLSFLRDVTPLANFSSIKVFTFAFIVIICIYLQIISFNKEDYTAENFSKHWLEVRGGFIESLGTFVFAFVAQHTVHLVFLSLRSDVRTVDNWEKVSTAGVTAATLISVGLGFSVYMTFWEDTTANMFEKYTPSRAIDIARILLSLCSLLTYPLPFVSCREMVVLSLPRSPTSSRDEENKMLISHTAVEPAPAFLLPDTESQLIGTYHVLLTIILYVISAYMAIKAQSLTDVLNLVGCATGTVLAFILPAMFSFKLRGYSFFPAFVLVVGGTVGVIGTLLCLKQILSGHAK